MADRGWRGGGAGPLPRSCFEERSDPALPKETLGLGCSPGRSGGHSLPCTSDDLAPDAVVAQESCRQQTASALVQGTVQQQQQQDRVDENEGGPNAPTQRTSSAPPRVLTEGRQSCPLRRALDHRWALRTSTSGNVDGLWQQTPQSQAEQKQKPPAPTPHGQALALALSLSQCPSPHDRTAPGPSQCQRTHTPFGVGSSAPQDSPHVRKDTPPLRAPETSPMKRLSSAPPKSPHNSQCGSDATTDVSVELHHSQTSCGQGLVPALRSHQGSPPLSTASSQVHSTCTIGTASAAPVGCAPFPSYPGDSVTDEAPKASRAMSPQRSESLHPQTPPHPRYGQRARSGEPLASQCTHSQQKLASASSEVASRAALQAQAQAHAQAQAQAQAPPQAQVVGLAAVVPCMMHAASTTSAASAHGSGPQPAETPPHPRLQRTARTATSPLRSPRRSVPSTSRPALTPGPQGCPTPPAALQAVHTQGHQTPVSSSTLLASAAAASRPAPGSLTMPATAAGPMGGHNQAAAGKRSSSVTAPSPTQPPASVVAQSTKGPARASSASGACQTPPAGPGPVALAAAAAARYAVHSGWGGAASVPTPAPLAKLGPAAAQVQVQPPSSAPTAVPAVPAVSPAEAAGSLQGTPGTSSPAVWAYPQALGSQSHQRSAQLLGTQGAASAGPTLRRLPTRSKVANNRRTSWKGGTARSCAPRALAPLEDDESVLTSECISIQQKLGKLRNKTTIAL